MPFGCNQRTTPRFYNKVELKLISQYDDQVITITAIEVPEICYDSFEVPNVDYRLINSMNMADVSIGGASTLSGISILIGADNYWKVVTGEFLRLSESLTAINTKLGWTLQGPTKENSASVSTTLVSALHVQINERNDNYELKQFWDLETIGINDRETQNEITAEFIENNIVKKNDRFEVSLPWKNNCPIDSNYESTVSRLKRLIFKLSKESKLVEYDKVIREFMNNNIAEEVPSNCNVRKVYYMPHRPVYREDRTTSKIRVVFDASAHAPGFPSLNDLLHAGENLVQDLMKVLLKFRIGSIAIIADIEKAFLQIALCEDDRDFHRFLWYKYPLNDLNALPSIQVYRMTRVTFGVTSSPFLLSASLKKLFAIESTRFPETSEKLANSFYVDDLVTTVNSFTEATKLYSESKHILATAGMNLRKWHSNNSEVHSYFNENEKNTQTCPKVLGFYWDTITDNLCIDLASITSFLEKTQNCTKRNVSQAVGRIYDPLGILGPFTITAKILLQRIWKLKLDWDTESPPELDTLWRKWCNELKEFANYAVPRNVVQQRDSSNRELHIFSDASTTAYGAVAYIQERNSIGFNVKMLIAKNRVAPIKDNNASELTLPKLELTAALCASRLKDYIVKTLQLEFDTINMWTDSKITLHWILSDASRWKTYVYNRVREIQDLTKTCVWRHCAGDVNPADLLTRGLKANDLIKRETWLNGPKFLSTEDENWVTELEVDACEAEICAINLVTKTEETSRLSPIFAMERFEHLEKCLRVTAYVKRVFQKSKSSSLILGSEELNESESYWIKITQVEAFNEEIVELKRNNVVENSSSIRKLTPFLDQSGILRIKSRLQEAELPFETANPIILPKKSPFVEKLVWKFHNRTFHSGINLTLAEIRKRFWIIKGRQTIKSILSRCIICKKLRAKPGREVFAPLPKDRTSITTPFETTGIDFAGPLYVQENNEKRKVYLMLLTCAVIRAVHLELLTDLTTESCINGLPRFISRRGVPKTIYSDNAKTFKRASLELNKLSEMLSKRKVAEFMTNHRIHWKFIVERAAWWGGFWERLIKTVKDCLKFSLGKSLVNIEELRTIFTEIEATVNSRPLTYIDDDKDNLSILTPSNFLLGNKRQCAFPDANITNIGRDAILLLWKERQRILTKFWKRWSSDYLQQLRTAHVNNWSSPLKPINVGDIVLLHDQSGSRLSWKMVRITQIFPGRDGRIRACEIKLPNNTLMRRPIQLLYPLEIPFAPGEDVENRERTNGDESSRVSAEKEE